MAAACETAEKKSTEADFCTEYAKRECAAIAPLCSASITACQPARAAACEARSAALKMVGYTMRAFRRDNVDECLAKVSETYKTLPVSGAALEALDKACNRVFQGSSKQLEACQVDFDCEGNLVCDPVKLLCGTGRVVPSRGQCANVGETCSAGEYCSRVGAAFLCAPRLAKAATGCSNDVLCLEGLQCVAGTCVDKAASGEGCTEHKSCQTGYCSPFARTCGAGLIYAEGGAACSAFVASFGAGGVPDAGQDL